MWVPLRHIGIVGNEMADKSAHTAIKTILHPTITNVPVNDIKVSIKQKIITTTHNNKLLRLCPASQKIKKIKNAPKSDKFLKT